MQTLDDDSHPATDEESVLHEMHDRNRAEVAVRARLFGGHSDPGAVAIAHAIVSAWNTHLLARFLRAMEA